VAGPELPDLVTAMMKLVERLEVMERKMDMVLGRVSNLPSEMRNAVQQFRRQEPPPQHSQQMPQHSGHGPAHVHNDVRRERVMYQATCADCCSECEVPFKPTAERPVYCKTCFAKRKSVGSNPKVNAGQTQVPEQRPGQAKIPDLANAKGNIQTPPVTSSKPGSSKGKKSKPAKKAKR
jgi:CxxC-x17-CxxC domain-containing protein